MKCPVCRNPMEWKEGLLTEGVRDMTVGRWYCIPCRVTRKMQESRGMKKGRKLAKEFEGVDALDKRITAFPMAVQMGILCERQKEFLKGRGN